MIKRKKVSVLFVALSILLITLLFFAAKCTVGYVRDKNGGFSAEEGAELLREYGWETDLRNVKIEQITIPAVFSPVYEKYNSLQQKQGYDLSKYKGEAAARYTYKINNYKGFDSVEAHILVWGGRVIGGDLCSTELNGFMKTLDGVKSN